MEKYKKKVYEYGLAMYMFLLPWDIYILLEKSVPFSPSFIFLIIILIIYILDLFKNNFFEITIPKYIQPLLLILLYSTFSLAWSLDKESGIATLIMVWSYFIVAILIYNIIKYKKIKIEKILYFYILGVVSVGVNSYVMHEGFSIRRFTIAEEYNPTLYATFLTWGLVSSVIVFRSSKTFKKIVIITSDIIMILLLFLTQGKNSILAISISMLLVVILYVIKNHGEENKYKIGIKKTTPKNFFKGAFIVTLISGITIGVLFGTGTNEELTKVANVTELINGDKSVATSGRTDIWLNYAKIFDSSILFGAGVESSAVRYGELYGISIDPHNTYLLMLIEYGVIGLLLWIVFLYSIIKYSLKQTSISFTLIWIVLITAFMGIGNDILYYKSWWVGIIIYLIITQNSIKRK